MKALFNLTDLGEDHRTWLRKKLYSRIQAGWTHL